MSKLPPLPVVNATPLSQAVNAQTTVSRRNLNNIFNTPGVTHGGARDMYEVFGYPNQLTWEDFFAIYRRHGIATRLTRGVARSCWRDIPGIEVDEQPVLEEELKILARKKMFRNLEQADTLNRIGRFSVLYVGVNDGMDPREPLGVVRSREALKGVFFQPYSEDGTEVNLYEADPANPRFGQPVLYSLTVRALDQEKLRSDTTSRVVHWTRIVHIAEDALDNDLEGLSALEPVFNFIIDLMKTQGGSSEAYWRNARRILAFNAKEGFGNATEKQLEQLRTDIEEFTNGWRDGLRLGGVEVTQLQATHADPKEAVLACFKLISGSTGIPMRILTGEGGGQTTGNEDKAAYNQLIKDRQEMMCSDWLLRTLEILGNAGLIEPLPLNAEIIWPVSESLNEVEKSEAAKNNGQALAFISQATADMGGLGGTMDPAQAVEEILDIKVEEPEGDGFNPGPGDLPPLPVVAPRTPSASPETQ